MNKYELVELMEFVSDQMRDYQNMRAGGNVGTAIQGMLQHNGAEKIAESLYRLRETIEKKFPDRKK